MAKQSGLRRILVRRAATLGLGTSATAVANLVAFLVVASIIGPGSFGLLSTILAAGTVLEFFVTFREEQLLPVVDNDKRPAYYSALAHSVSRRLTATGLIAVAIVLLWGDRVSSVTVFGTLSVGAANSITNVGTYTLLARGQTKQLVVRKVVVAVLLCLFMITAAATTGSVLLLCAAYLASRAPMLVPESSWLAVAPSVSVSDRRASRHVFAGQLASNLALQAPVFLSSSFFGPVVTGQFALGRRVIGQMVQIITSSGSEALMRTAPGLSDRTMRRLGGTVLAATAGLAIVAVGVAYIVGQLLGPVVSADWSGALDYLPPVALIASSQIFISPFATLFAVKRLERERNIWLWTRLVVVLGVGLLAQNSDSRSFFWYLAAAAFSASMLLPLYAIFRKPGSPRSESALGEAPDVWFVAGYGRSGSTVTAQWLAATRLNGGREVISFGELGPWLSAANSQGDEWPTCSCGKPVDQCGYWQGLIADLADRDGPPPRMQRFLSSGIGLFLPRQVLVHLVRRGDLFSEHRGLLAPGSVIVDASKTTLGNANAPRIWAALGAEVSTVTVSRPLGSVIASRRAAFGRQGRRPPALWRVRTVVSRALATFLGQVSQLMTSGVVVRYGDRPECDVLCDALDLDRNEVLSSRPPGHMAGGNRLRYRTG